MNLPLSIPAFLLVLGVLITVHELGHFLVAKLVGIRVLRFSIGIGPRLVGFKRGETEYQLAWLPVGGYVKMAGQEELSTIEGEAEYEPSPRDFSARPVWARMAAVLAGVGMNFLTAILLSAVLLMVQGKVILPPTIGAVRSERAPSVVGVDALTRGDRVLAVNGELVEDWGGILQRIAASSTDRLTLTIEGRGHPVELQIPDQKAREQLLLALDVLIPPKISEVRTGSPAERAGIRPGDLVLAVDGYRTETWGEFTERVRAAPGGTLSLLVRREGVALELTAVPEPVQSVDESGRSVEIGQLGVVVQYDRRRVGAPAALTNGTRQTALLTAAMVAGLVDLVRGEASWRSLAGPVFIFQLSGEMASRGWSDLANLIVLLSVAIAVINLLPIPVLDGGHVVFLAAEAVRRRPLSPKVRLRLTQAGLVVILMLFTWVMASDIMRLLGI